MSKTRYPTTSKVGGMCNKRLGQQCDRPIYRLDDPEFQPRKTRSSSMYWKLRPVARMQCRQRQIRGRRDISSPMLPRMETCAWIKPSDIPFLHECSYDMHKADQIRLFEGVGRLSYDNTMMGKTFSPGRKKRPGLPNCCLCMMADRQGQSQGTIGKETRNREWLVKAPRIWNVTTSA